MYKKMVDVDKDAPTAEEHDAGGGGGHADTPDHTAARAGGLTTRA